MLLILRRPERLFLVFLYEMPIFIGLKHLMFQIDCNVSMILEKKKRSFINSENIQPFDLHGQQLWKFGGTEEKILQEKKFNSHRIGLGHRYGRRDFM